jgi:acylpyruvate hydrolase
MAYASYEFSGRRWVGRVEGDRLVPLAGLSELGRDTPAGVLASAPDAAEAPVPVSSVRLLPVVPNPDKILCVGLNYHSHVGETGRELPSYPVLFTKFASSLIGASDDIVLPPESAQVDYEAELAVVIGRPGRRIPRASALEHVLGYTVANDVTMRDYQYKTHQWIQGKAWDRSTPLGPYLVTPGEVDLASAGIRTVLGGTTLQSSDLSKLIFDVPTLIATVSEFCTLLPGDVILTGTPGGVGYRRSPQVFLADGDEVVVEIDGVGRLANRVRAEVLPAVGASDAAGGPVADAVALVP